jgi:DNA-binding transcriptional ArsR family regulator
MLAHISTVVNIEVCGYAGHVDDVKILQAIAEPTRLSIVRQLASDGEVCACDFTDCCGVSQPTVSHHLKVLREAGVVSCERRGTWIYYRLEPKAAAKVAALGHLLSAGARREPKRVTAKPALARA